MTNDEWDVASVLKQAVEAAAGSPQAMPGMEALGLDGSTRSAGSAVERSAPAEPAPAETRTGEAAQGRGSSGTVLDSIAPLVTQVSGGNTVSKVVSWINPLAGALLSLFGRKESAPQIELPKAVRPASIHYEAGIRGAGGEMVQVDRDAQGQLRSAEPGPSVVVKVEAMDSRSFLDRTPEIAEAVKRALLESEGLGRLMNPD
ncbi:MAG: hypothetical protein HY821_22650 [Acidobacteria bacterium]|nr:hypothetical protein [Acidobacteriota bacterium]